MSRPHSSARATAQARASRVALFTISARVSFSDTNPLYATTANPTVPTPVTIVHSSAGFVGVSISHNLDQNSMLPPENGPNISMRNLRPSISQRAMKKAESYRATVRAAREGARETRRNSRLWCRRR